jgi:hypothetical protein
MVCAFPLSRNMRFVADLAHTFTEAPFGKKYKRLTREYDRLAAERRALGIPHDVVFADLAALQRAVHARLDENDREGAVA